MAEKVTFTVFLKDMMSKGLDKIKVHGKNAFTTLSNHFNVLNSSAKKVGLSIEQIDKELKLLNARKIKLHIDDSELTQVNKSIMALNAQRNMLQNKGVTGRVAGGKSSSSMLKYGLYGAAIAGAYKVGRFISSSVGDYNEQAQQEAQLAAGIESTGGVAGKTVSGLRSQAEFLQGKTLYGDEQTEGAQKILLTFTKVRGEIFDKSIPLMQDMATRMGTDLPSAALQLGKALNDPVIGVTALQRAGVQLDKQQKEQVKKFVELGDLQSAQAIILKELQVEFAGSAEAAARAGTGGLTVLKNKIGDLKENIGEVVYKGIGPMAKAFTNLTSQAVKYTKVNPVTDMMREKQMFIELAKSGQDVVLSKKQQIDVLQQMRNLQPDFLKGLDLEKVSNEQIRDAVNDSLIAYDKRIKYMTTELTIQTQIVDKLQDYTGALTAVTETQGLMNAGSFQQKSSNLVTGAWAANLLAGINNFGGGIFNQATRISTFGMKTSNDIIGEGAFGMKSPLKAIEKGIVDGQNTLDKLDKYNKLLEEAGSKNLLLEKDKKILEKNKGISSKISQLELDLKKGGATQEEIDYIKQYYTDKFYKSENGNKNLNGGNTPGFDTEGLKKIGSGGAPVKQVNIYLESLINTNNNNFEQGQGPAEATDFINKLTDALQTIVNDVNYSV